MYTKISFIGLSSGLGFEVKPFVFVDLNVLELGFGFVSIL